MGFRAAIVYKFNPLAHRELMVAMKNRRNGCSMQGTMAMPFPRARSNYFNVMRFNLGTGAAGNGKKNGLHLVHTKDGYHVIP
jgi:hypothetical protein